MPKVYVGKNGGKYYMKAGKKVYLSKFGAPAVSKMAEPLQDDGHILLSDFIGTDAMDEITKQLYSEEIGQLFRASKGFRNVGSLKDWKIWLEETEDSFDFYPDDDPPSHITGSEGSMEGRSEAHDFAERIVKRLTKKGIILDTNLLSDDVVDDYVERVVDPISSYYFILYRKLDYESSVVNYNHSMAKLKLIDMMMRARRSWPGSGTKKDRLKAIINVVITKQKLEKHGKKEKWRNSLRRTI
jgi:hypothetical protein